MKQNNKTLYVGGSFDDNTGKYSKTAGLIFNGMSQIQKNSEVHYHNGGNFSELEEIANNIQDYAIAFWFANVPNDKKKLIKRLKAKNKSLVLVTSKRNMENQYSFSDLIYHALGNRSNLFVEFGTNGKNYHGRIIDPLGNVFLDYCDDFSLLGKILDKRVGELSSYSRVRGQKTGRGIAIENKGSFFKTVKDYAKVFHNLVHPNPEAANRLMGNASFRCERGFPSYKKDDLIFVSRRNIDKRFVDQNSFVAVKSTEENIVKYFGDFKPSVDTPIQVRLYQYYPNVKCMIHSHTYIHDAPFTENLVPCGAIEEVNEVTSLFPKRESVNFAVNLRGHGSIFLAGNPDNLQNIPYIPRIVPEVHSNYLASGRKKS